MALTVRSRYGAACASVALHLATGALAAQHGKFPWKSSDVAPAVGPVHLGDRRAALDSALGAPSDSEAAEDSALLLFYDSAGIWVMYSNTIGVTQAFTQNPSFSIGSVHVGLRLSDVRDRWGPPVETDSGVSVYDAGRWVVLVSADSPQVKIAKLGVALTASPEPYDVPDTSDVFRVVAGTWDWEGAEGFCHDNPHTISFSSRRDTMTLTFVKPDTAEDGSVTRAWRYKIYGHTRHSVRGFIQGETRRTDAGKLVVWDLVLMSRDGYRWHRTDWAPGGYTKQVLRCPHGH